MRASTNDVSDGAGTAGAVVRALVVDDDASARRRIVDLLAAEHDIAVVGECADGQSAVTMLTRPDVMEPVDLLFLDVRMAGLTGFDVLSQVGLARAPLVIFCSAYDEYAVKAFEAYALDYLLKPFDDHRFADALARARAQISLRRVASLNPSGAQAHDARLAGLLEHVAPRAQQGRYPEALAVRSGAQYIVIRLADVQWIEADGNHTHLHMQPRPRVLSKSLVVLERDVLDPESFVRVHRSAIVNVHRIRAAESSPNGELLLLLADGSRVPCSRRYRRRLEALLYFIA